MIYRLPTAEIRKKFRISAGFSSSNVPKSPWNSLLLVCLRSLIWMIEFRSTLGVRFPSYSPWRSPAPGFRCFQPHLRAGEARGLGYPKGYQGGPAILRKWPEHLLCAWDWLYARGGGLFQCKAHSGVCSSRKAVTFTGVFPKALSLLGPGRPREEQPKPQFPRSQNELITFNLGTRSCAPASEGSRLVPSALANEVRTQTCPLKLEVFEEKWIFFNDRIVIADKAA